MSKENELQQAKVRNKKYPITDVAIQKVPFIKYKGLNEEQNKNMQSLAKLVLKIAQEENDSNEVAITWDMGTDSIEKYGVVYGTEHAVDICSDTYSNHLLHSVDNVIIVLLHNHPSTRTISFDDVFVLMEYRPIQYMVVVSNQGTIHYLKKEKNYDENAAGMLYNECRAKCKGTKDVEKIYASTLEFLKRCSEVGLYCQ